MSREKTTTQKKPSEGPANNLRTIATRTAKAMLPDRAFLWLKSVANGQAFKPAPNKVDFGDFRRLSPFCRDFGTKRGESIDRYYIEKFLRDNSALISGTVLEISEDTYTKKYGGDRVTASEVLHYDDPSPPATMTGDLTDAPHIPSNHYDCVIITQTLMLIYDVQAAVATLNRILKPGGTVIVTMAGLTQITNNEWADTWHWGFTKHSAKRLFEDAFVGGQVDVQTYGNVLTTISFLHGLAQEELTQAEYDVVDPEYQMLIGVIARKSLDA